MADVDLNAARRDFADLTGLIEDAAFLASVGQGVQTLIGARRQRRRVSTTMDRIRRRLAILERRLK